MYDCHVEGCSYVPVGAIKRHIKDTEPFVNITKEDVGLRYFASCATLCNDARLEIVSDSSGIRYLRQGEPTEAALKVCVLF